MGKTHQYQQLFVTPVLIQQSVLCLDYLPITKCFASFFGRRYLIAGLSLPQWDYLIVRETPTILVRAWKREIVVDCFSWYPNPWCRLSPHVYTRTYDMIWMSVSCFILNVHQVRHVCCRLYIQTAGKRMLAKLELCRCLRCLHVVSCNRPSQRTPRARIYIVHCFTILQPYAWRLCNKHILLFSLLDRGYHETLMRQKKKKSVPRD